MKLLETRVDHRDGVVRLVAVVERSTPRETFELFFEFPSECASFVHDSADPFVPALLVPCHKLGEDLELVPPISGRLLRRLPRIQDILVSWHAPVFRRIAVLARPRLELERDLGTAVGAMFSAGVDSFYTLLKSLRGETAETPPITHLLYMRGLETPLDQARGTDETLRQIEEVARAVGKRVIPGTTNLRAHFSLNYELYYHGGALTAAALALSGGLRWLLLPSSYSWAQLFPWGSHPLLDELWSTERLEVVHDGCEARRVDKIERLVAWAPLALEHLRVCLDNQGGAFNCGRCRKCVRTMIALDLLGALPRARTFPQRFDEGAPSVLRQDVEPMLDELLEVARRLGTRPDLVRLLERTAGRRRRRQALRTFITNVPVLRDALPLVDRRRSRLRRLLFGSDER
jgi:hypothetical protein